MGKRSKDKRNNKNNGNNNKSNNKDDRKSVCEVERNQTIYLSADDIEEAVYRAIKRGIEDDNTKSELNVRKMKWNEHLLFWFNIVFFPFHICKKIRLKERIYDSVLVIVVSGTFMFGGRLLWLMGLFGMIALPIGMITKSISLSISAALQVLICFVCTIMGSLLYLSGKEFSNEIDSDKIYAYSASFFAMVGCMVAVITLLLQYF